MQYPHEADPRCGKISLINWRSYAGVEYWNYQVFDGDGNLVATGGPCNSSDEAYNNAQNEAARFQMG